MLPGLQVGRIVHYVLSAGDGCRTEAIGRHVPAIIVNDWAHLGREDGYANLTLFLDWSNDGFYSGLAWATSRTYSEGKEPGTWHWPERV